MTAFKSVLYVQIKLLNHTICLNIYRLAKSSVLCKASNVHKHLNLCFSIVDVFAEKGGM